MSLPPTVALVCAALLFAAPSLASPTIHLVLPDGTGDFAKIQDALDAAVSGDEIVLGDGTFLGARNRDLNFLGKNLTLRAQSGDPALCTIDCQGASRGLSVTQGETDVLVEGITIQNGFGPWGGGINCMNVTATFRRCVITRCSADDSFGAAIAAGAYAINSRVTFEDCTFAENFFALRGTGAGLFAWGNSNVTATRCRFIGNHARGTTAGGTGGGIRVQDSRLTLIDCEIVGNQAKTGAGISTGQLCIVDFRNCLIAGNVSNDAADGTSIAGGIQFGYDTDGSVESCTIVGNRAHDRGAGIHVANDCNLTFMKTILWGNCIEGVGVESAYLLSLGALDFHCSDVDPLTVQGGTVTYTNSLAVDPLFCAPEPCANAPTSAGAYTLDGSSPLASAAGCGLIGRSPVACGTSVGVPDGPLAAHGLGIHGAPNPSRGNTTLHYALPEPGRVAVEVFDAAGRLVVRFDEGTRERGPHTIAWDGRSRNGARVSSGAYFVRVTSGGRTAGDWIIRVE
ncbi:MAG: right-handed parallel beta-helix repeat-containing protein [Candidatus Eiseniibacteriota bacterium]